MIRMSCSPIRSIRSTRRKACSVVAGSRAAIPSICFLSRLHYLFCRLGGSNLALERIDVFGKSSQSPERLQRVASCFSIAKNHHLLSCWIEICRHQNRGLVESVAVVASGAVMDGFVERASINRSDVTSMMADRTIVSPALASWSKSFICGFLCGRSTRSHNPGSY